MYVEMPRIIAGKAKGLKLKSLKGEQTRPSGDRLKEALFSIIQARLVGSDFLDVFAGSGQMGLEALSRGANSACLIEKNRQAAQVLAANIALSQLEGAELLRGDAVKELKGLIQQERRFDLVYLDPPWGQAENLLEQIQPLLSSLLRPDALVVVELDQAQADLSDLFSLPMVKTCHYGRAMLLFYNVNDGE